MPSLPSLHDAMLNIPCSVPAKDSSGIPISLSSYREGHKDARHAAAMEALKADSTLANLVKKIEELHAERDALRDQLRKLGF